MHLEPSRIEVGVKSADSPRSAAATSGTAAGSGGGGAAATAAAAGAAAGLRLTTGTMPASSRLGRCLFGAATGAGPRHHGLLRRANKGTGGSQTPAPSTGDKGGVSTPPLGEEMCPVHGQDWLYLTFWPFSPV